MKNERIIGFVLKDSQEIPFEFSTKNFELNLFLTSTEELEQHRYDSFFDFFSEDENEHKWIDNIEIRGITADRQFIIFGTVDQPVNEYGFLTYKINWAFVSESESFEFNKVGISGADVDNFYSPSTAFSSSIEKDENGKPTGEMYVKAQKSPLFYGGEYRLNDYDITITAIAYPKLYHYSKKPFTADSVLYLEFSKKIDYSEVKKRVLTATQFLRYITYRKNVSINNIDLWNDDKRIGKLLIPYVEKETHEKASQKSIRNFNLNEKTAKVFEAIENKELSFDHLCPTISSRQHYTLARFIMILARFECEYGLLYTGEKEISKKRSSMISLVQELILESIQTGIFNKDYKKHLESLSNTVEHAKFGYGDNVKHALADCKNVMQIKVAQAYPGVEYDEAIKEIGYRMGQLRNAVAHEKLDFKLEAVHVVDIKIMEALIYAIRLKSIGIDEENIVDCINKIV